MGCQCHAITGGLSSPFIIERDIDLTLVAPDFVPIRLTMAYDIEKIWTRHSSDWSVQRIGTLIFSQSNIGRVGVLHANDIIPRIHMVDFAGDAARHVAQQIEG